MDAKTQEIGLNLSATKQELTAEGKKQKETRLKELINTERPAILIQLSEARAQGDLSENADYDFAKEKQAEIESEIASIEAILANVTIIKKSKGDRVTLGSTVTYTKGTTTQVIKIVGPLEADPLEEIPMVAYNTPLAKALIGASKGDIVKVRVEKSYKINITKITQ
ncbi:MAG: transcription elongation factor GreA [Tenericutes bacterium]|nr:MAG: transcription elongation factor GreA [Mycoplasmatota bacterium]